MILSFALYASSLNGLSAFASVAINPPQFAGVDLPG
jgi:hypothetical protein